MRFIVMGIATKETERGAPPTPEAFAGMQAYNEDLAKRGILLAAEGLSPTSKGARVKFNHAESDGKGEVEIRKLMDIEDFGEAFTPNEEIAKVKF